MRILVRSLLIASFLVTGTIQASSGRVAVTPKLSTLGLGADLSFKVKQRFSVRVMGQQFGYETNGEVDGVDYDVDYDLQSIGTLVDLFPTNGKFRLSAGLLANGNELRTSGRLDPTQSYQIGGSSFTGAALGDMDGTVEFASTAPFAGIGWGNPFKQERRLAFSADLGFVHQRIENADLRSSNPFADPLIDQEMESEEQQFEEDVEWLEFYPVLSVGMSIRF